VNHTDASIGLIACVALLGACAEDRILQPQGSADGGPIADATPGTPTPVHGSDATPSLGCNMTGTWVVAQVTHSVALGAQQKSVNWFLHEIDQSGGRFEIVRSLNCGFRVTGTTTATLGDPALGALAKFTSSSVGRRGTMTETEDGTRCRFELDRTYNIHGANKARFLTDHWRTGDPPKDLAEFPPLPEDAASGMEDWDGDGVEGLTIRTGLGDRHVAQRDWNDHAGFVPKAADEFGGENVVVAAWDGQEVVSKVTNPLLRVRSEPESPGFAHYRRLSAGEITFRESGATPEVDTCKDVQRKALELWPDL
jgi:hypothetical protein